jgi:hypothetical protein
MFFHLWHGWVILLAEWQIVRYCTRMARKHNKFYKTLISSEPEALRTRLVVSIETSWVVDMSDVVWVVTVTSLCLLLQGLVATPPPTPPPQLSLSQSEWGEGGGGGLSFQLNKTFAQTDTTNWKLSIIWREKSYWMTANAKNTPAMGQAFYEKWFVTLICKLFIVWCLDLIVKRWWSF